MCRSCYIAIGLLLGVSGLQAANPAAPIAHSEHHYVEVRELGDGLGLTRKSDLILVVPPDYSAAIEPIYVPEPLFGDLDEFEVRINGDKVSDEHIVEIYPRMEDEFYTEQRVIGVVLEGMARGGDSIHVSYEVEYENTFHLPLLPVRHHDFLKQYRATLKFPDGLQPAFELTYPRDSLATRVEHPSDREIVIRIDSVESSSPLPYSRDRKLLAMVSFSLRDRQGNALTASTPAAYVRWFSGLTSLRPPIQAELIPSELHRGSTEARTYLRELHNFTRKNIRYVAQGRQDHAIVPDAPDEVLSRRWGDCKDRAALVTALAHHYDIPVHMALVGPGAGWADEHVHPSRFNHVICYWQDGDRGVFFDPTARFRSFGELDDQLVNQPALVLDPDNPRWVTPVREESEPYFDMQITASIDSLNTAAATITLRGTQLVALRHSVDRHTGKVLKSRIRSGLSAQLNNMAVEEYDIVSDSANEMKLSATVDLANLIVLSRSRRYLPTTITDLVDRQITVRADDPYPIVFDYTDWYRVRLAVHAPNWRVKADSTVLSGPGDVMARADVGSGPNDTLVVTWCVRRLDRVFTGDDRVAFLRFCEAYFAQRNRLFVIEELDS